MFSLLDMIRMKHSIVACTGTDTCRGILWALSV